MLRLLIVVVAALGVACAGSTNEQGVVAQNDAIEDYILVAELESLDSIRTRKQFHHKVITERYIILTDGRNSYLAAFDRRCWELKQTEITPDVCHDRHTIRARFDTYRGCRLGHLYAVTEGQAQELIQVGTNEDK